MTHYVDTIADLVKHAEQGKSLPDLATVLTHYLAELIVKYGADATCHVLARLGTSISRQIEQQRAAAEAEEARVAGRMPN